MTPYIRDSDLTLYVGDVLDVLPTLPAESVDCVITSPPYWGLRDYGTGVWDGGDPACDHENRSGRTDRPRGALEGGMATVEASTLFRDVCGKCGAQRVDRQLGLEPTPDAYVQNMVAVFRQVWRVLAPHGTVFLNIADSYWSNPSGGLTGSTLTRGGKQTTASRAAHAARRDAAQRDTACTPPQGSPDPGSAYLDLCGECAADLTSRSPRTDPPGREAAAPASPTDRDSERPGSDAEPPAASPPGAQGSTTLESSPQPPAVCWRCGDRPASVSLQVRTTSSPDAQASAHTGSNTTGTSSTSPSSDGHTTDTEPSALAHLYSTIASRRLRQKDAVLIPQLLALALQCDGWIVRSEIVWSKKNCMPESVTDRPTKSHEQIWLLSKGPRYWFDQEAVREPHNHDGRRVTAVVGGEGSIQHRDGERWPNGGRNVRSVWEIATQPYAGAHFATYPEELVRRALLAGCPVRVCRVCGRPSERIVKRVETKQGEEYARRMERAGSDFTPLHQPNRAAAQVPTRYNLSQSRAETVGWSDCGHDSWRPGVVLDPFGGSGTTALVARNHGRHAVLVELNQQYADLAADRLSQLSLLAEVGS